MARTRIPSKVQSKVLADFNHLCAICARPRPHIHHIDGDPSNNDAQNLLPLCPNHHLLDAHDPTQIMPPLQLRIFRQFRDPQILMSQFVPLLDRLRFLCEAEFSAESFSQFELRARDLIAFVRFLHHGGYYADRISQLIGWDDLNKPSNAEHGLPPATVRQFIDSKRTDPSAQQAYLQALEKHGPEVVRLTVESLRFQNWQRAPRHGDA